MTSTLLAVRHGRTGWNDAGLYQGWADPPLDDVGRRQAAECAADIAAGRRSREPRLVLCSDRSRAVETAVAIGRELHAPVTPDAALREVDLGEWAGLTAAAAERRFPDEYRRWTAGEDVRRGGGETVAEAGQRAADRIAAELSDGSASELIVVGHGLSLAAAVALLADWGAVILGGPMPRLANCQRVEVPVVPGWAQPAPKTASL